MKMNHTGKELAVFVWKLLRRFEILYFMCKHDVVGVFVTVNCEHRWVTTRYSYFSIFSASLISIG
jgi:hypothetical protein